MVSAWCRSGCSGARGGDRQRSLQRDPWERSSVDHGPLSDLVVSITGPGWYRETTSDAAGKYELTGLPTGPMSIAVAAPHGFGRRYLERPGTLPDARACVQADFELALSSVASGSVLDGGGRPLEGIEVDAVAEELAAHRPPAYQWPVRTDAFGRFDLPPGRYVFGVRLTEPSSKVADLPVFLPGTLDAVEARVVELAAGDRADVGVIRLPVR